MHSTRFFPSQKVISDSIIHAGAVAHLLERRPLQVPSFGKRRKLLLAIQQNQLADHVDQSLERLEKTSAASERDARQLVRSNFGVLSPPWSHTWCALHNELKRYELSWRFASTQERILRMKLVDYFSHTSLFDLIVDCQLNDVFCLLFQESIELLTSVLSSPESMSQPSSGSPTGRGHKESTRWPIWKVIHCLESNSAYKQLRISLYPSPLWDSRIDELDATWLCVKLEEASRFDPTGHEPLLLDVPLCVFGSILTRSAVIFFEQRDLGIRNIEHFSPKDISDQFVPRWKVLRQLSGLSKADWPVGPALLKV